MRTLESEKEEGSQKSRGVSSESGFQGSRRSVIDTGQQRGALPTLRKGRWEDSLGWLWALDEPVRLHTQVCQVGTPAQSIHLSGGQGPFCAPRRKVTPSQAPGFRDKVTRLFCPQLQTFGSSIV